MEKSEKKDKRKWILLMLALLLLVAALILLFLHLGAPSPDKTNNKDKNDTYQHDDYRAKDVDISTETAQDERADSNLFGSAGGLFIQGKDEASTDKTDATQTGTIKVTFQVECSAALGSAGKITPEITKDGVIQKEISLQLPAGSSAEDVLRKSGIKYEASYGYLSSVEWLSAGAAGEKSAWFYCVNGDYPEAAIDSYQLKNNDKLVIRYSLEDGTDIGVC